MNYVLIIKFVKSMNNTNMRKEMLIQVSKNANEFSRVVICEARFIFKLVG